MEILGSQIIPASQQAVWDALNSPDVLKKCLPGCESVERVSPDLFKVVITAAIGPLKAKFNGTLQVTEANPPASCVLVFEGQGGAVGFGKGTSSVTLKQLENGTELTYSAQAHVGGKLAQIGSRLIDSVAKKMSDDFFKAFNSELGGNTAPAAQQNASTSSPSTSVVPALAASSAPASNTTSSIPSTGNSSQQVPASWLIIAAGVGAAIVIIAQLLLK
ncbi:MAG: carbon monoxide dehydrogenase subunit G [Betaproteobacteria bacterium]|jgi:carbon monoxide dehydrogenase subunit G